MRKQRVIRGIALASILLAFSTCQMQINKGALTNGHMNLRFLVQGGANSAGRNLTASPTKARLILANAQSLTVMISQQGEVKATKTVNIAAGQSIVDVSFDSIALIPYEVKAQAFDGADGSGTILFQATASQNVSQGMTAVVVNLVPASNANNAVPALPAHELVSDNLGPNQFHSWYIADDALPGTSFTLRVNAPSNIQVFPQDGSGNLLSRQESGTAPRQFVETISQSGGVYLTFYNNDPSNTYPISFQVLDMQGFHVYIAGVVGPTSNSQNTPVYWKDGVLKYLPLNMGNTGGYANWIAQDKSGNVYIGGEQWGSSGSQLGYWKNETFVVVNPNPSSGQYVQNVSIDSNGKVWITSTDGNTWWFQVSGASNQTQFSVSSGTINSIWAAQADTLGNVYFFGANLTTVAGQNNGNPGNVGVYWKQGGGLPTPLPLSGGNIFAFPSGSAIDGSGNIYCAGGQFPGATNPTATNFGPVYWKMTGGVCASAIPFNWSSLPPNNGWNLGGMTVDSSGNIYLVSGTGPGPIAVPVDPSWTLVYWKGVGNAPIQMQLPSGKTVSSSYYSPVALDPQDNLIVSGQVGTVAGSWNIPDGVPVYWKNAIPNLLPMGTGNAWGTTTGVVVAP